MKQFSILIFLCLIISTSINIFGQQIPILNLAQAIEHPENIALSDFVESVTYIPLATTYDCFVDKNPRVYVTKEYIVVVTTYKCLVFNRKNGEFVRVIGNSGRGPGEYQSTYMGLLMKIYLRIILEGGVGIW